MNSVYNVGDRVWVPFGRRRVSGVISEARGGIGFRGRDLFQVLVFMDPFEPATFELPADEIEPMVEGAEHETDLEKEQIINYLVNGGLIAILRSNWSGGRNQPRVWLRPDSVGNVTHTFEQERGVVGGDVVPCMAVHDNKIFSPKREDVLTFLQSFQLDRPDAEKIVVSVGTAPSSTRAATPDVADLI